MNTVFTAVFIVSAAALAAIAPQEFLNSMLAGVRQSLTVALTLFCIYAVWMGLAAVAEECGITDKVSRAMKPLCKRIFKTESEKACGAAAMNLACNLLGAGASTPFAVTAIGEFEREGNGFAQRLLFVLNATGIQLIPTTVIALRASYGSTAAADIVLPSLICSCIATAVAVGVFLLTELPFKRQGRTQPRARVRIRRRRGGKWR